MKVAVFCDNEKETIIVGLNGDGALMDPSKILFGPESGRDIDDYERTDVDIEGGEVIHIELENNLEFSVFKP